MTALFVPFRCALSVFHRTTFYRKPGCCPAFWCSVAYVVVTTPIRNISSTQNQHNLISPKIKPIIDRCYTLAETAKAIAYLGHGHTKGKVVITVSHDNGNRP